MCNSRADDGNHLNLGMENIYLIFDWVPLKISKTKQLSDDHELTGFNWYSVNLIYIMI